MYNGHGLGFTDFNRFMLLVDAGFTFAKLGDYGQARGLLSEGLDIYPHVPHALNALGVTIAHSSGPDDPSAMEYLQRALR